MFDDFHGPLRVGEPRTAAEEGVSRSRDHGGHARSSGVQVLLHARRATRRSPGIGSFLAGRTWEKGGSSPHLRTILDDAGRPMVFINWNTDMGDGWEWSNVEEYPGYLKYTSMAYRMAINEIVYSLTH